MARKQYLGMSTKINNFSVIDGMLAPLKRI